KNSSARWQLVRKRNGKRLFRQFRINRVTERIVVILFVLSACGFQTEFMQRVPCLFIGIATDHCQNWSAEIRWKRRRIREVFPETLAAAGDNVPVIQESERAD